MNETARAVLKSALEEARGRVDKYTDLLRTVEDELAACRDRLDTAKTNLAALEAALENRL